MCPDLPRRRSVRLPYYNYASYGWYYITICCHQFKQLFGSIESSQLRPSPLGELVSAELERSAELRKEFRLDTFVIMSNHLHMVVVIDPPQSLDQLRNTVDESGRMVLLKAPLGGQARSVSSFVGGFKASVTSAARHWTGNAELAVWNRGFHEHVVRSEPALNAIREYIANNPRKWELDRYNTARKLARSADDELDLLLAADQPPAK
ncbi:transposase [bacterium]|nr:transposase [bacterium]